MLLTSASNKTIKFLISLKKRAIREKEQLVFLEGERLVNDSASYGADIKSVYIKEGYIGKIPCCNNVFTLTSTLFDKVCETKTPQGIIAVAKMPIYKFDKINNGVSIICDNLRDPGNLGTIIRTAHAVKATAVILTKGTVDPFNMKTVRASMGSVFSIPIIYSDINEIQNLKKCGITICSAIPNDNPISIFDLELDKNTAFVIGNEADGITDNIIEISDRQFMIPMPGGTESLNAAVAASICLYEYLRQNI